MADFEKMEGQEIENISGGAGYGGNIKTVFVTSGYLAVRTAPAYRYENEIQSTKLYNGDTAGAKEYFAKSLAIVPSPKIAFELKLMN
jgi:hypothetical protein